MYVFHDSHSANHSTLPATSTHVLSNTAEKEHAPLLSLTIMVVPSAIGQVQIHVSQDASAAHVLEQVCRVCQLGSPTSYSLLHRDINDIIPPHQLVTDFSSTHELILVERTSLRREASLAQHTNGPLPEQPKYKNAMDLISSYKARIFDLHVRLIP